LGLRPEDLRTLVARDATLNEIFLRAFVLCRLLLINRQLGTVVVIGSQVSFHDALFLATSALCETGRRTAKAGDASEESRNLVTRW
jgi:hypothetical protein